ncbi:MAG: CAP domain-containing protein [Candidatus Schekmanbacteria bacterium]|nr:MAG: CAP domain-containing protein [Candidatus Schekmanbacteria bacterium]
MCNQWNRKFLIIVFSLILLTGYSVNRVDAVKNRRNTLKVKNAFPLYEKSYRIGISASKLKSLGKYMLKLINKDRKKNGLAKVKWDSIAAKAGQKHSDEMAKGGYLSHWNKKGQKPDQRYTNAGGRDYVAENVYMHCEFSGDIALSKKRIKSAEKTFMNSAGHRANILRGTHTHVGIGIAVKNGCIFISQEFVDRFGTYGKIPKKADVGEEIIITGTLDSGVDFDFIGIYWEEKPKKMSKKKLKKTGSYSSPETFDKVTYYNKSSGVIINGQSFSLQAPVGDFGPGLYYVRIRVVKDGNDALASQRTILVK